MIEQVSLSLSSRGSGRYIKSPLDSDENGVFEFDTWTTYHKSIFEVGVIDTIKTGKENVFDKIFNREINLTYD